MVPRLITPGRIAATLGVPLHRVLHVLRPRGPISPLRPAPERCGYSTGEPWR